MKRMIIIGGGVGPMAGVLLHKHIITQTVTGGTDQDHIDVIHLSYASRIEDRTRYLQGEVNDNPGLVMARILEEAYITVQRFDQEAAAGVPCSTFHADPILSVCRTYLRNNCPNLSLVNMLQETISYIQARIPKCRKLGMLSTTGTRQSRVWEKALDRAGISLIHIPEELQDRLHQDIYNKKWGIKALSRASSGVKSDLEGFCKMLINEGAEGIVLGCTEIPLAFSIDSFLGIPLIDPMIALARGLVRQADPDKLLPLSHMSLSQQSPSEDAGPEV